MKQKKATRRSLRLLAALLLLCQLFCAVSCGTDENPEATTEAATEGDTPMDNTPEELQLLTAGDLLIDGTSLRTGYVHEDPTYDFSDRFIDAMCEMGVVGESKGGSRPRELLLSRAEYEERKHRVFDD